VVCVSKQSVLLFLENEQVLAFPYAGAFADWQCPPTVEAKFRTGGLVAQCAAASVLLL